MAETYPPDYGGGAAAYIQSISRYLAARGHDVRVFCSGNRRGEPYEVWTELDQGVSVSRVNLPYFRTQDPDGWGLGLRRWVRHEARVLRVLDAFLRDWRPHIVQYNAARPLGEGLVFELAGRGLPVVMMFHEAWAICARVMLLRSPLAVPCEGPAIARCLQCMYSHYDGSSMRAAMKMPWRIVKLGIYPAYRLWRRALLRRLLRGGMAYSNFMADRHRSHIRGPVRHITLGVDLATVPKHQPARPRTPLRFGFVGGSHEGKGLLDILDAAASLKRCGSRFEVHLWGPGLEAVGREVEARDLQDRVFQHGLYALQELWTVYTEIDVALMATRVLEPFGRVVQEAAASGVPTIAPNVGGISEQIRHGIDGLLFSFRNKVDLEEQMRRVLHESDLVPNLIANLRPVVDTRSAAADVERFYRDVLAMDLFRDHARITDREQPRLS